MLTDMHCHILPGVDDGAKTLAISVKMLQAAKKAGISRIIATPHLYAVSEMEIELDAFEKLEPIAREEGVEMIMGFEVNWRAIAKQNLRALDGMCLGDSKSILFELPSRTVLPNWEYIIGEMCQNYTPIIAHPERLPYIQKHFEMAMEMRDIGCEFQIDAFALLGSLWNSETRTAKKLLRSGLADYIATDAHCTTEYELFAKARQKFRGEWPKRTLEV